MKDPNVDFREMSHLEAECEGTHHRSLENNSSVMEGHFTSAAAHLVAHSVVTVPLIVLWAPRYRSAVTKRSRAFQSPIEAARKSRVECLP